MDRPLRFMVVDIETLGFEPPAALIELGWTSVDARTTGVAESRWDFRFGQVVGEKFFGIPEGQLMCPSNRAVHHIDPGDLYGRPVFDVDEWRDYSDADYGVAHNSAFERLWLDPLFPRWICTYKCAVRAWPEAPSHSNQALKYYLSMPDREDLYPPHRALPDAKVTAYILSALLVLYDVETLLRWSDEPRLITKMPFGKHQGTLLTELEDGYLSWALSERGLDDGTGKNDDLLHWLWVERERRNAHH